MKVQHYLDNPVFRLPDIKDESLVASWLNPAVRNKGVDYSVNGYDLTKIGGAKYDEVGAIFNGSTGYFKKSIANFRSSDSAGTIEAFVKINTTGVTHCIFSSCDEGSTSYYFALRITTGNVVEIFQKNNDTADQLRGSITLDAGQYYRIMLSSNGSVYSMRINNTQETLTALFGANHGDWFADTNNRDNIIIGALEDSGGVINYLNGSLACLNIYNTFKSTSFDSYRWKQSIPEAV